MQSHRGYENQALKILEALKGWKEQHHKTHGFIIDKSTPFRFRDGQVHQVDAGWVNGGSYLEAKNPGNGYPVIYPDFIVKFSEADFQILESTKAEMAQLRDYGCSLGWLIEPKSEYVFIYQPNQQIHQVPTFDYYIDGRGVLEDFEFPLKRLRY